MGSALDEAIAKAEREAKQAEEAAKKSKESLQQFLAQPSKDDDAARVVLPAQAMKADSAPPPVVVTMGRHDENPGTDRGCDCSCDDCRVDLCDYCSTDISGRAYMAVGFALLLVTMGWHVVVRVPAMKWEVFEQSTSIGVDYTLMCESQLSCTNDCKDDCELDHACRGFVEDAPGSRCSFRADFGSDAGLSFGDLIEGRSFSAKSTLYTIDRQTLYERFGEDLWEVIRNALLLPSEKILFTNFIPRDAAANASSNTAEDINGDAFSYVVGILLALLFVMILLALHLLLLLAWWVLILVVTPYCLGRLVLRPHLCVRDPFKCIAEGCSLCLKCAGPACLFLFDFVMDTPIGIIFVCCALICEHRGRQERSRTML